MICLTELEYLLNPLLLAANSIVCTVQTWVQSANPKRYSSFTLPHQPRTLELFKLHQPRTGIFA